MITVVFEYASDIEPQSDFEAKRLVRDWIELYNENPSEDLYLSVCNVSILYAFELAVYEGKIPCNALTLVYNDDIVEGMTHERDYYFHTKNINPIVKYK